MERAIYDVPTAWSNHIWSIPAVSAAITKSTEIIKLTSNSSDVLVSVHRELLCFFSSYYSAALNGEFLEARKDQFEVNLTGKQLKAFATWLYTGDMTESARYNDTDLYVFADQVDILALRRAALSEIVRKDKLLTYDHLVYIHSNLARGSPLLRWVTDHYIAHWHPDHDEDDSCPLDSDTDPDHNLARFVYQVLKGVATRDDVDLPGCRCCNDVCEYHEHPSKEEWETTCGQDENSEMPASLKEADQLESSDQEN